MKTFYIVRYCDQEIRVRAKPEWEENADALFTSVSKTICFDDCTDEEVIAIFYKGKEVRYAGWQHGMKFEYKDLSGKTVWVGEFPHWDH